MTNYGFYVDTDRCIKCWTCEIACKQWHGIEAGTIAMRKVYEKTEGTYPDVKRTFYSLACLQCSKPACVEQCPTAAIEKREEDGIIQVIADKCTGCGICVDACPFGIPQISDKFAYICDCCLSIGVEPGKTPHCVEACPMQALQFGEKDVDNEVVDGDALAAITVALKSVNSEPEELVTPATVIKSADDMPKPPEGSGSAASASAASAGAASSSAASAEAASASAASAEAAEASGSAASASAEKSEEGAAPSGDSCG